MSGYLGARTQIADSGAYNREQADDLFPSKESVVSFSSTGTNTTMVKPPVYGIRVLEFTGATGTITLPDMSGQPGGGRFRIMKNNSTQGSVNINLSGTNTGIWGAVQLKLNADGDFWEVMWTGSRFVLTDGHETGSDGNGDYVKSLSGNLVCTRTYSDTYTFNSSGNIFISDSVAVDLSANSVNGFVASGGHNGGWLVNFGSNPTIRLAASSGGTFTRTVYISAQGRWYE